MAKKRTKLDKMSKKERTSLAYAMATNIAKYGRPQSPKNERKLSKGEMKTREKEVKKLVHPNQRVKVFTTDNQYFSVW